MATEYISRNEAINRLQEISNDYEDAGDMDAFYVADYCLKHIMELCLETDVEEVVHCINCINWNGNECITMYGLNAPKPNDYCSRGERRSDND